MVKVKKIFEQTFWQILGKIVTSLSTFVILGLVARNYGQKGVGVFTLALTYLSIFYLLSDFGFNAHVLKKATGDRLRITMEWQKLLGTRIMWSLILLVIAVSLLPFWPFATTELSQAVLFGSLAIAASAVYSTCNLIFQSSQRYDLSVLASSVGIIISLVFFIFLISFKYAIPYLLLVHLLGWVLNAFLGIILVKRINPSVFPIFDMHYTMNLFRKSWPIAATLALNVVYFRADSFLIAYFKGVSDVGIYNVAYSIFQSVLVLPAFIMNAYYPMMLKSFSGIKRVGLGLFALAALGSVFTIFAAPLVVKIITGGGFIGSTESLKILSLGFPAYFLSSLFMWVMVTKGRYKLMLMIYGVGLLMNLILNLIYIPHYSYIAAAYTTVASEYLILTLQAVSLIL